MKPRIIIILASIILLTFSSCKFDNKTGSSPGKTSSYTYKGKDSKAPKSNSPTYVGSGFTSTQKEKLEKLGRKEDKGSHSRYQLKKGSSFKGSFFIDNHDKKRDYAVVALLDYKQVPLIIDGKNKLLHLIGMGKFEKHIFSIETQPLGKKAHDFVILAFWSPNNHSLNQEARETSEFAFSASRANLIASNSPLPKVNFENVKGLANKSYDGIFLNLSNKIGVLDTKKVIKASKKLTYYIHAGNASKTAKSYALTAFVDYKQIPINGKKTFFLNIKPKQRMLIKSNTAALNNKGTHELLIIATANPFVRLPEINEKLRVDSFSYSTTRIAVIVR